MKKSLLQTLIERGQTDSGKPLAAVLNPEVRVLSKEEGTIQFIASDNSIDSHNSILRADGWRFTRFQKNAPFLDSHNADSITTRLGNVVDWSVMGGKLLETVKYALGINELADFAFKMTAAGFLPAVSVRFDPIKFATKWDSDTTDFNDQVRQLKLTPEQIEQLDYVVIEQEQLELSAVNIGSNMNAIARAYKADVISEEDIQKISKRIAQAKTAAPAAHRADADAARRRARDAFLLEFHRHL